MLRHKSRPTAACKAISHQDSPTSTSLRELGSRRGTPALWGQCHLPQGFASTVPCIGTGSGAGGKWLLLHPGSGSGSATKRQGMGRAKGGFNAAAPPVQPRAGAGCNQDISHTLAPGTRFLPIGGRRDGAPRGTRRGEASSPQPAAEPPEPTASSFLLLSFFLSVLSPLCLL